jgi:peptidoglycan/xylan/chitin deacetylase (PgdA/CDA1 family)
MSSDDPSRIAAMLAAQLADRRIFFTTSWDDGLRTDLRLVELGQAHRIPMMLFVCPAHANGRAMTSAELCEVARVVDIGSHTLTHVPIDDCTPAVARERVVSGRAVLEATLGRPVPHFALVGGRYTSVNLQAIGSSFESVRSAHAFNFRRPVQGDLIRPSLQIRFRGRTHPLKMLWEAWTRLSLRGFARAATRIASGDGQHDMLPIVPTLSSAREIYLHLWGHSEDIEKSGAWDELASLFAVVNATRMVPMTYGQFIAANPGTSTCAVTAA